MALKVGSSPFWEPSVHRGRRRVFCGYNREGPTVLRLVVSAATELLRLVQSSSTARTVEENVAASSLKKEGQSILSVLEADYERAYFLTGNFTRTVYAEDCIFADPTIKFKGTELYEKNLKLLVPFYQDPSLTLTSIEELVEEGTRVIKTSWKLRTYIKFPWKPFISLDGSTRYELNSSFKIIKHEESWNITPLQAISQLFVPSKQS